VVVVCGAGTLVREDVVIGREFALIIDGEMVYENGFDRTTSPVISLLFYRPGSSPHDYERSGRFAL